MLYSKPSAEQFFDYDNQCWIVDGKVQNCGHPETMACGCYGRAHKGETSNATPKGE